MSDTNRDQCCLTNDVGILVLGRVSSSVVHLDVIVHGVSGDLLGAIDAQRIFAGVTAAFQPWRVSVEEVIAQGDTVVVRLTESGTMVGSLLGMAPTGRHFTLPAVRICRLAGGKLAETRGFRDTGSMMRRPGGAAEGGNAMSIEANEALYLRYLDALTAPDADALRALLASDFVAHDLPPALRDAGPEGLIRFRAMANAAVPDQKVELLHVVTTGDLVAAHMRVTGTHQGVFRGIAPTGRAITWEVFEFARIAGGKIAERWALVEWVKIYQQMGVTEIPQG